MLNSNQIHRFKEIAYSHQGLVNNPFTYSNQVTKCYENFLRPKYSTCSYMCTSDWDNIYSKNGISKFNSKIDILKHT